MQQNVGNGQSPTNPPVYNLDPSVAAKQMAALNSAAMARRATHGPSNDKSQSPSVPFATISSYQPPASAASMNPPQPSHGMPGGPTLPQQQAQPQQQQQGQQQQINNVQRQRVGFLQGISHFMSRAGNPLPPNITGVHVPNYDPNTSPWKLLEPGTELGTFRLSGKNIDIFKLFNVVFSNGGSSKFNAAAWANLAQHVFELPPEIVQVPGKPVPAGTLIAAYHKKMIGPFEEVWQKNVAARQQQARAAGGSVPMIASHNTGIQQQQQQQPQQQPQQAQPQQQPQQPPQQSQAPGGGPQQQTPENQGPLLSGAPPPRLSSGAPGEQQQAAPQIQPDGQRQEGDPYRARSETHMSTSEQQHEMDEQSLKRKREESVNVDAKRARMSTDEDMAAKPTRRKIEYLPFVRDMTTHGGRDLRSIEAAMSRQATIRPLHTPDDFGTIDIDGLTMSLKSRIPSELSFCFTALTMLSTMRGAQPNVGFPLQHTDDLLDELLEFLDEQAFGGKDLPVALPPPPSTPHSYRELCELVLEEGNSSLLDPSKRPSKKSPLQPPSAHILVVLNFIRNFSLTMENQAHLGKVPIVLRTILRIACLVDDPEGNVSVRPASKELTMRDLLQVRRDAMHIFMDSASTIDLSVHDPSVSVQLFELISSFLVDPFEAVGPFAVATMKGPITSSFPPPPALAEMALELFTKVAQPDQNRQQLARHVSQEAQWRLFEALLHRLPVSDRDYKLVMVDSWFGYIDKLIFALYCLVFMAPPAVKHKIRRKTSLGFGPVLLRMIKRFALQFPPEYRQIYVYSARRAIETLKLVDEGKDSFETPENSMPSVAFGMGYGEEGHNLDELGNGMLGGYQDEITWGVMRSAIMDGVTFNEMESLARLA